MLALVGMKGMGQNLIPNGDFELGPDSISIGWYWGINDTINCNLYVGVPGPDFWTASNGSPDRIIEGQIYQCMGFANDTAESGNAYIDLYSYEAGKTTLIDSLLQGSTYYLSCYFQWNCHFGAQYSLIRFNFNNSGNSILSFPITDTLNWVLFDTIFVADTNSTEMEIASVGPFGLTEIDNISHIKLSSTEYSNYLSKLNKIKVLPTPFTLQTTLTLQGSYHSPTLFMYNIMGQDVRSISIGSNKQITIYRDQLPVGMYFYKVIEDNKEVLGIGKMVV